jgi:type II secretory pathway component GspD/PulD (secretin)
MIDDVEPDLDDFSSGFKMRIQDVTMAPFGNFTGPVLDITPTISTDSVHIQFRIGTELATFFFSTAFLVDGTPTDAEIPLHRRSTTAAGFTVPMGQTLVIGGLRRTGAPQDENGLPVLGDIPLLGSMFTHKHLDPDENRLLVFLTPTIVDLE